MWVVFTVLSYYLLLAIVLSADSLQTGSFWISSSTMMEIYEIDITGMGLTEIFLYWWGMPLLVSITLCITEIIISLFIQPILSFFVMLAYFMVSSYWSNPMFLGNYTMLKRQDVNSGILSISPQNCLISCVLLGLIVVTVGMLCFKSKDIFQLQREA